VTATNHRKITFLTIFILVTFLTFFLFSKRFLFKKSWQSSERQAQKAFSNFKIAATK